MNLKNLTIKDLYDRLAKLLGQSNRTDPAGDALRAAKAEESARKEAN